MKKHRIDNLYDDFFTTLEYLRKENSLPEDFYRALSTGDSKVYQKHITENKVFDQEWINTVERLLPSVDKIIRNPKSGLRYDEDVVPIEKVKKINNASIRHLASHTQYIREVQEDDFVIPSKLLTSEPEIEYGTYENRFIKTLINRLFIFIRMRSEVIKKNITTYDRIHLAFNSDFNIKATGVKMNIDFELSNKTSNRKIISENQKLLLRVEYLNKLIMGMKSSWFMEELRLYPDVYSPITKTNVIIKNVDFQNAYQLWVFMDRYNTLVFDLKITEKSLDVDKKYLADLQDASLIAFMAVAVNQEKRRDNYEKINWTGYTRKGIRQLKTHPHDNFGRPEPKMIEDNRINEYFLEKNREIFAKTVRENLANSENYEIGIKRALRETVQIGNALFASYFGISNDDDFYVIQKEEFDPKKYLEQTKDRARVARYIREVKEVDYRESLRLEKKMLREQEAATYQRSLERKQIARTDAQKYREDEKIRRDKKIAWRKDKALTDKSNLTKKNDRQAKIYRDNIKDKMRKVTLDSNDYVEDIKTKETTRARKIYRSEAKKIDERLNKDLVQLRAKNKKEIKRQKARLKAYEKKRKIAAQVKAQREKTKIREKLEKDLKMKKALAAREKEKLKK